MNPNESMLGKWDEWYKNVDTIGSFRYGETITYRLAADFLSDVAEVEDWGCGTGGFRRFYSGKYIGVDGSANKFVDKIADLRSYRSNVDGIMMRHILEHNYDWKPVLENAVASFNKKFCLVLFTPFAEETKEIAHNKQHGVDVPDISFCKKDIECCFEGLSWRLQENIATHTGYGMEHIYYVERPAPKIAVISANLGKMDNKFEHVPQSLSCDFFDFTDENFPPRHKAMGPRLQAKIPKFFAWQLKPGYDYYVWVDGSFTFTHPDAVKYFYDACRGYDMVFLKHPVRGTIRQEWKYMRRKMAEPFPPMVERYENEWMDEQYEVIAADKDFTDDFLVCGGFFIYRHTPKIENMFKEWWYNVSRYAVQDQLALPYVLKKNGVKINIMPDNYLNFPYAKWRMHNRE